MIDVHNDASMIRVFGFGIEGFVVFIEAGLISDFSARQRCFGCWIALCLLRFEL